jgi:hypothetical protein
MRHSNTFRRTLFSTYAILSVLCFLFVVRLIVLYKPNDATPLELLLKGLAVTAGFIGVLHPIVRHRLLGQHELTSLGRLISNRFGIWPDQLAQALVFPWQVSAYSSALLFFIDFVLGLRRSGS